MGKKELPAAVGRWMKDDKKMRLVLVIGFAVIAVIFISSFWDTGQKKPSDQPADEQTTTEEYARQLEVQVAELLEGVEGVGKTNVMLTLETGSQYVYQSEQKRSDSERTQSDNGQRSSDTQETIVMVDGDNGKKQALVKTELAPKIRGIVVVCEGAGSVTVESQIISVLTTAFDIPSTRVSVVKSAP